MPRQCSGSGHRNGVSRDIGIACRRSSEWPTARRLRHVETSPCHRCCSRRSVQSEVARTYGVSQGWISRLMARYRAEGEAAFEPRSRRPHSSPDATPPQTVELVAAAAQAAHRGRSGRRRRHDRLAPGPPSPTTLSRATINRILVRAGAVSPGPVQATQVVLHPVRKPSNPTRCWQSDFTHYRLRRRHRRARSCAGSTTTPATPSRSPPTAGSPARSSSPRSATAVASHGVPASTLTDNGMVFTTRLSGGKGGRNDLEHELRDLDITQKNCRPNHPTTCGKVERFQQTLKKWLRAQPTSPPRIAELQTLLDAVRRRVQPATGRTAHCHTSATPATAYTTRPKATPRSDRSTDTHDRVRRDKHRQGRQRHPARRRPDSTTSASAEPTPEPTSSCSSRTSTSRVINAATGEILRDLIIDPRRDYQPTGRPPGPTKKIGPNLQNAGPGLFRCPETSHVCPRQDSNLRRTV